MSRFIHEDTITRDSFGEEDGYDIIQTDDGFTVYQSSMTLETFDTLDEATKYANERADEDEAAIADEERRRIIMAREKGQIRSIAREIADAAAFLIEQRAGKLCDPNAKREVREEVQTMLGWRF
jgi:hypothetical protein